MCLQTTLKGHVQLWWTVFIQETGTWVFLIIGLCLAGRKCQVLRINDLGAALGR